MRAVPPKIPPNVKNCAKKCFLVHLPIRAACAIGVSEPAPDILAAWRCNPAVHLSPLTCTAACIAGSE